jgi:hypothetical protein
MQRMDTMLTNAVLGPNVSDFRVEWTWADGVGRDTDVSFSGSDDPDDDSDLRLRGGLPGVVVEGSMLTNCFLDDEQEVVAFGGVPWFGLSNDDIGSAPASAFIDPDANEVLPPEFGTTGWSHIGDPGQRYSPDPGSCGGDGVRIGPPVGPELGSGLYKLVNPYGLQTNETLSHIEFGDHPGNSPGSRIRRYGAVFGFNGENAILRKPSGEPYVFSGGTPVLGSRVVGSGADERAVSTYTPWPTAVRISFRLHDSEARLEGGRAFEFIIPLPRADS